MNCGGSAIDWGSSFFSSKASSIQSTYYSFAFFFHREKEGKILKLAGTFDPSKASLQLTATPAMNNNFVATNY
jgi:hypothetical protein